MSWVSGWFGRFVGAWFGASDADAPSTRGALVLTGHAPVVTATTRIPLSGGGGQFWRRVTTVFRVPDWRRYPEPQRVDPARCAVRIQGYAPSILTPHSARSGTGALTIAAHAPTVRVTDWESDDMEDLLLLVAARWFT